MGRDRKRYTYSINLEKQRYRVVRCFNSLGVNFNVLVLAETDEEAIRVTAQNEPGFEYEAAGLYIHRLFIDQKFLIN